MRSKFEMCRNEVYRVEFNCPLVWSTGTSQSQFLPAKSARVGWRHMASTDSSLGVNARHPAFLSLPSASQIRRAPVLFCPITFLTFELTRGPFVRRITYTTDMRNFTMVNLSNL